MMSDIFIKLLNISITAGYAILAVIALRILLKRTPKWLICLLWLPVGLRLVLPFSLESRFSLIPSSQVISQNAASNGEPVINSGIEIIDQTLNPVISQVFPSMPIPTSKIDPMQSFVSVVSYVWAAGAVVMLLYCLISYVRLGKRVRPSMRLEKNVYVCDNIESPFILGIIKPRIYLPSDMIREDQDFVIDHETAHIKRLDHLIKPLSFLLLSVYWFNPLMWIAYMLLSRDIEKACDEKVIKKMTLNEKKRYSSTLLSFSAHRKMITACPLAFGEVGVKERVKNVLNYKKPVFYIILVSLLAVAAVTVCFVTDPFSQGKNQALPSGSESVTTTEPVDEPQPPTVTTDPDTVDPPAPILMDFDGTDEQGNKWFYASVKDVGDGYLDISPYYGTYERNICDEMRAYTDVSVDPGTVVKVTYDGNIGKYPTSINTFKVEICGANGASVSHGKIYSSLTSTALKGVGYEWLIDTADNKSSFGDPDKHFPINVFETKTEFDAYLKGFEDRGHSDHADYFRQLDFSGAIFEKYTVAVVYMSGTSRYDVNGVINKDGRLIISLVGHDHDLYEEGTFVYGSFVMYFIPKSVAEGINEYDAVVDYECIGEYLCADGEYELTKPRLVLKRDGRYKLIFTQVSEHVGEGTFTIRDGYLTLTENKGGNVYVFKINNNGYRLTFDAKNSSDELHGAYLIDGYDLERVG